MTAAFDQRIAALWDFDDAPASEARFRLAAESAERAGAAAERDLLLTQLARALGLQARFAEGHALLDELGSASSSNPGASPELQVRIDLERGRLHRSAGDLDAAAPCFASAAERADQAHLEGLHVDALHMQALLAGTAEDQVCATRAALVVARASTDHGARRWIPSLLNNLGMALVDAGRLTDALDTFQEALAERTRQGRPGEIRVARWMVAWTLRLLGRRDEARAIQRALKQELLAAGEEDPYVDEELALLAETDG